MIKSSSIRFTADSFKKQKQTNPWHISLCVEKENLQTMGVCFGWLETVFEEENRLWWTLRKNSKDLLVLFLKVTFC